MATTYWYRGSRWRDYMILLNNAGTVITGEAANFTISILGPSGDVATTGVSITEPDPASNAGTYQITADPLSSFLTEAGQYSIVARNSTYGRVFQEILIVTTGDNPSEYIDGDLFGATVGDGRVTDGSAALEDAIVSIIDSGNSIVYQAQTDADGLWNAILDSGTYSITVSLAGYARKTATITVAGGTGSVGSDIAMTSTTSGALTAGALFAYTRRQMGDTIGEKAVAVMVEAVNAALRNISRDLNDHPWWETDGTMTLRALYNTGTVSLPDGSTVVTLSGGVWPSWAEYAEIYIGGTWYFVESRNSDTEIVLSDVSPVADQTGVVFQMARVSYPMPDDLHKVAQTVFYKNTWPYGSEPTSYEEIQRAKHFRINDANKLWASHQNTFCVWPPVDEDVVSRFMYYRAPAKVAYEAPSVAVDIDPLLEDVIEAAIDVQLLRRGYYEGSESPRDSYKAAIDSARIAASKRASAHPGIGGRSRFREHRLAYNRRE